MEKLTQYGYYYFFEFHTLALYSFSFHFQALLFSFLLYFVSFKRCPKETSKILSNFLSLQSWREKKIMLNVPFRSSCMLGRRILKAIFLEVSWSSMMKSIIWINFFSFKWDAIENSLYAIEDRIFLSRIKLASSLWKYLKMVYYHHYNICNCFI